MLNRRTHLSRIVLDLPVAQLEALAKLVEIEGRPRAAIIRDAIQAYISQSNRSMGTTVFGLWKNKNLDGLTYQERARREWDIPHPDRAP
jgi:hypothetical protein